MIELLTYGFIQRAFLGGTFLAALCACLGLFLVLRQNAMIGDGLSHVSLGAVALGLFIGIYPILVAIPLVILASLLIFEVSERAEIYGDSAISIISAVGVSSGVIIVSLAHGFNADLLSYLFGNILAISQSETLISVLLAICVMAILKMFYVDLAMTTFSLDLAKTSGINTKLVSRILVILTAITVVLSIRVVGVMLVSALLTIPALAALQVSTSLGQSLRNSILFAVMATFLGIIGSFWLNLPTGACIVLVLVIVFLGSYLVKISKN